MNQPAMSTRYLPAAALLSLFSGGAAAQFRCDCTTVVDSCTAQVAIRGNWVEVTTDRRECARVDYFIDGQPFVAVVADGEDRQNWMSRTESPRVLVQSCQVCQDASATARPRPAPAAATASSSGDAPRALEPLIEVPPAYPPAAQARALDGHVDVEFTVNAAGAVENARVVEAEPAEVFDQAALAAVSRWRYPAMEGRAPETLRERVEFRFADYLWQLPTGRAPAPASLAPAAAEPMNQCARENATYNYGDMVEVGLVNACAAPLLVFGCAQGTGSRLGRWACTDSDRLQMALAPGGDARLGTLTQIATPTGSQSYRYVDELFLTRAPNSEYWWIACQETDEICRDIARQWVRSINGQLASVDPRARADIAVARSY
jgi:TonB family protein